MYSINNNEAINQLLYIRIVTIRPPLKWIISKLHASLAKENSVYVIGKNCILQRKILQVTFFCSYNKQMIRHCQKNWR